ncbi:LuxR C-terminal-related transcriptional regulator [Micromonospora sp. NPDC050795]|uniref:LuxR C-terminal-related transcriptional regulator n=1 Tax=Micromonospora sp. NPDC050795 TaxID=3364282 RepID=UPI003799019F
MPVPHSIEVLIAHPEPAGRAEMLAHLRGRPPVRVVGVIGNTADATAEAGRLRPAVILIDDRMTTPGRIEALARWSQVILLTGVTEPHAVAALLHEPARGYLVYGNFEPTDLLGAVHAVAKGLAWLSPIAASSALTEVHACSGRPSPGPRPDPARAALTPRERQVLELLCQGLSVAAIACALKITDKTARNHIGRGFVKLGVHGRREALRLLNGA